MSFRGVIHENGVVPDGNNPLAQSPPIKRPGKLMFRSIRAPIYTQETPKVGQFYQKYTEITIDL